MKELHGAYQDNDGWIEAAEDRGKTAIRRQCELSGILLLLLLLLCQPRVWMVTEGVSNLNFVEEGERFSDRGRLC